MLVLLSSWSDADQYDTGQQAMLSLNVLLNGALTNATTVQVKIKDPSGALTTLTLAGGGVVQGANGVANSAQTGQYYALFATVLQGIHSYTWTTTGGGVPGTASGEFWVRKQAVV